MAKMLMYWYWTVLYTAKDYDVSVFHWQVVTEHDSLPDGELTVTMAAVICFILDRTMTDISDLRATQGRQQSTLYLLFVY